MIVDTVPCWLPLGEGLLRSSSESFLWLVFRNPLCWMWSLANPQTTSSSSLPSSPWREKASSLPLPLEYASLGLIWEISRQNNFLFSIWTTEMWQDGGMVGKTERTWYFKPNLAFVEIPSAGFVPKVSLWSTVPFGLGCDISLQVFSAENL